MRFPDGPVFLGIDIGSSGVKAVATNGGFEQIGAAGRGQFTVDRPTAGGWEIDPVGLFEAACEAIRDLPDEVRAATQGICLTGQMCGLVPLGRDRRPVGACLPIFDDRSVAESKALDEAMGDRVRVREGNRPLPVYTLPKLLWLRSRQPQTFRETDLVMLPKDFVRGCLTGIWVTEPSDASGTLAMSQLTNDWDEQLLEALELSPHLWPHIVGSSDCVGEISTDVAKATGLPPSTPVVAGASDMAAVAVGVGATSTRDIVVSFGTAVHLIAPTDELTDVWPIQQYTSALGSPWFRFGAVYSGAVCAQWLLDLTADPGGFSLFDLTAERPKGEEVLFMPYLAGAGSPHEVPTAAGAFLGLRLGHGRRDLAQAVLLGLVLEASAIRRALDPGDERRVFVTGGGMRLGPIVQMLADALQCGVFPAASADSAAVGAARLAALSFGLAAPETAPSVTNVVVPDATGVERTTDVRRRYERAAALIRELGADD